MPYIGFTTSKRAGTVEIMTEPEWTACGSDRSSATWVQTPDGKRVCTMRQSEEDWSRAVLIAAAPELLAALRQSIPLLRAHYTNSTEGATTIRIAQAAIEKATRP